MVHGDSVQWGGKATEGKWVDLELPEKEPLPIDQARQHFAGLTFGDHVNDPRRGDPIEIVDLEPIRRPDARSRFAAVELDESKNLAAELTCRHGNELTVR